MSLLVHELSQITSRITVVAPGRSELLKLFESLSYDVATKIGIGQKLDLQMAAPTEGAVKAWASFTLGTRGKLNVRLSLIGAHLEPGTPLPSTLFDISDALFFDFSPKLDATDEILRLKMSPEVGARPCLIAGLNEENPSLRTLALSEWSKRNFQQLFYLKKPEDFLSEGLEWLLSF